MADIYRFPPRDPAPGAELLGKSLSTLSIEAVLEPSDDVTQQTLAVGEAGTELIKSKLQQGAQALPVDGSDQVGD